MPEVVDVVDIVDIVDAATIDGASVSADTCRGQPGVVDIVRVFEQPFWSGGAIKVADIVHYHYYYYYSLKEEEEE